MDKKLLIVESNRSQYNGFKKTILFISIVFVLLFIGFIVFITQMEQKPISRPTPVHKSFDYFVFAIRWPPSQCLISDCIDDYTQDWLIHGLWPTYWDGSWPSYCPGEPDFNVTKLRPIRNTLERIWGNLEYGKTADSLWSHEWTKHGTCSSSARGLNGELNYFNGTLSLFNYYPLSRWLRDYKITPQDSDDYPYKTNDLFDAVNKGAGSNPQLQCVFKKKITDLPVLSAIYICLDKNSLNTIDCPENNESTCTGDDIVFPSKSFYKA